MAVMYHTWLTTHVLVKKNSPQSCGNWPSLDGRENKNTWSRGTSIDDLSSWGKHWKGDVLKVSNPLFLGSHIVMAKQGGTWISWIHGRRRRLRNSADHCGGWWCQWYSDAPRGRSFPEDLWGMTYCGPVTCFYMSHQKCTGWLVNKKRDWYTELTVLFTCLKIEDGNMIPSAFHVSWMLGSTWFDQQSGKDWEVRTCQRLRTHDAELMLAQGTSNMTRENVRVSDFQCLCTLR